MLSKTESGWIYEREAEAVLQIMMIPNVRMYYVVTYVAGTYCRAGVAILKLVGPGPYPPKKSGGTQARFYPISAKKWWGPGPTGPYRDSSPAYMYLLAQNHMSTSHTKRAMQKIKGGCREEKW